LFQSVATINLRRTYVGQLSLAIPPWVGAMSTGQMAVMLATGSKDRYGVVYR